MCVFVANTSQALNHCCQLNRPMFCGSCYFIDTEKIIVIMRLAKLSLIYNDYVVEDNLCRELSITHCLGIQLNKLKTYCCFHGHFHRNRRRHGNRTIENRDCKTLKARLTSLQAAPCVRAKCFRRAPCGLLIFWTIVEYCGHMPSAR